MYSTDDSTVRASIENHCENNQNVIVKIIWTKTTPMHERILKDLRCSGALRQTLTNEVAVNGISKQLIKNSLENQNNHGRVFTKFFYKSFFNNLFLLESQKTTKVHILKNLRYEFKMRDRISRDILIDSQACKTLCEKLCLHPTKEDELVGYVQQIYQDPFGLMLLSSIQVNLINN